jgi:hypothetical protein
LRANDNLDGRARSAGRPHGGRRRVGQEREGVKGTYDLGEIQTVSADGVEDQVLQLVDDAEQVIAESSHCGWWEANTECSSLRLEGLVLAQVAQSQDGFFWLGPLRVLVEVGAGDAGAVGCWTGPHGWIFLAEAQRPKQRDRESTPRDHLRDYGSQAPQRAATLFIKLILLPAGASVSPLWRSGDEKGEHTKTHARGNGMRKMKRWWEGEKGRRKRAGKDILQQRWSARADDGLCARAGAGGPGSVFMLGRIIRGQATGAAVYPVPVAFVQV